MSDTTKIDKFMELYNEAMQAVNKDSKNYDLFVKWDGKLYDFIEDNQLDGVEEVEHVMKYWENFQSQVINYTVFNLLGKYAELIQKSDILAKEEVRQIDAEIKKIQEKTGLDDTLIAAVPVIQKFYELKQESLRKTAPAPVEEKKPKPFSMLDKRTATAPKTAAVS